MCATCAGYLRLGQGPHSLSFRPVVLPDSAARSPDMMYLTNLRCSLLAGVVNRLGVGSIERYPNARACHPCRPATQVIKVQVPDSSRNSRVMVAVDGKDRTQPDVQRDKCIRASSRQRSDGQMHVLEDVLRLVIVLAPWKWLFFLAGPHRAETFRFH